MTSEQRRAWAYLVTSIGGYLVYLVIVLGRAQDRPLVEVSYVPVLLWAVGGAIVATVVFQTALAARWPEDAGQADQRDREINRFGEHIGQSFVVVGGVAALVLAMFEVDHFWIANALYLGFVLSAVLGSVAKLFAYHRGFHAW